MNSDYVSIFLNPQFTPHHSLRVIDQIDTCPKKDKAHNEGSSRFATRYVKAQRWLAIGEEGHAGEQDHNGTQNG